MVRLTADGENPAHRPDQRWLRTIAGVRYGRLKQQEVRTLAAWSMWSNRLRPWYDLARGDTVYLVEKRPDGSRWITWETQIIGAVSRHIYPDLDAAALYIKTRYEIEKQDFLKNPYTANAATHGYLMACEFKPLRKMDMPLPAAIKLARCGWTDLTEMDHKRRYQLGLGPKPPAPSKRKPTPLPKWSPPVRYD